MTSSLDSWPDFMESEVLSLEEWEAERLAEEELAADDNPPRNWTEDPQ